MVEKEEEEVVVVVEEDKEEVTRNDVPFVIFSRIRGVEATQPLAQSYKREDDKETQEIKTNTEQ